MSGKHKLIHFGKDYLTSVRSEKQGQRSGGCYKPNGLWVSVEGGKSFGWRAWCEAESFGDMESQKQTEIVLRPDASILWIKNAAQLDRFTDEYFDGREKPSYMLYAREPDWQRVAREYGGIVIAPYLWSRRLHHRTRWYYGWDCASGCIWDASAIAELRQRAANPATGD